MLLRIWHLKNAVLPQDVLVAGLWNALHQPLSLIGGAVLLTC
jgi:hypothetical protein